MSKKGVIRLVEPTKHLPIVEAMVSVWILKLRSCGVQLNVIDEVIKSMEMFLEDQKDD